MCLAEFMRKDTPGREAAPAKRGRGHPTENKQSRRSPLAVPRKQEEKGGREAG